MKPLDTLLLAGDCLLYRPSGLLDWLVCIKTGARISHVEVFVGAGQSISAQPGKGVGIRSLRTKNLAYVRRPAGGELQLSLGKAFDLIGKKYDWLGLLGFFLAVRRGSKNRYFCSELATMIYRDSWFYTSKCNPGFIPFNPGIHADHFSPADFYNAGTFDTIWSDES